MVRAASLNRIVGWAKALFCAVPTPFSLACDSVGTARRAPLPTLRVDATGTRFSPATCGAYFRPTHVENPATTRAPIYCGNDDENWFDLRKIFWLAIWFSRNSIIYSLCSLDDSRSNDILPIFWRYLHDKYCIQRNRCETRDRRRDQADRPHGNPGEVGQVLR